MVAIRPSEDRERPSLTEATRSLSAFLGHPGLVWKPLDPFFCSAALSLLRSIWSHNALLPYLWCKTWALPPPFSVAATLLFGFPSTLPSMAAEGSTAPHHNSSLLAPQMASRQRSLLQGLHSAPGGEKFRIHTAGLTHAGATDNKELSRGFKVTIAGLQNPSPSGSLLTPGGPLELLPSAVFSEGWLTIPSLL